MLANTIHCNDAHNFIRLNPVKLRILFDVFEFQHESQSLPMQYAG